MKSKMDAASEELERRSRYLSSLIQRTKIKAEGDHQGADQEEEEKHEMELKSTTKHEMELKSTSKHRNHHRQQPIQHEKQKQKGDCDGGDGEDDPVEVPENVRVRAADMPPALQRRAFRCAREVHAAMPKLDSKRLALALKKEFDSTYGPAWHCIVGTSFGSYVTHSLGGFLYFSIDKVYILLFRTAVEPLDHR